MAKDVTWSICILHFFHVCHATALFTKQRKSIHCFSWCTWCFGLCTSCPLHCDSVFVTFGIWYLLRKKTSYMEVELRTKLLKSYTGLVDLEPLRQLKSSSFLQDKESSDYVFSETLSRTHLFGNKAASVSSPTVTDNTFNYYYLSWLSLFVFVTKTDINRYSFMQIFHTDQSQGNDTQRGIKFVILASTMRA